MKVSITLNRACDPVPQKIVLFYISFISPEKKINSLATDKYKAGYADCAREVARYLQTPEPPPLPSVPQLSDSGCKTRLLRHLDQCIAEIETEICPRVDPATVANATAKSTISDKLG